MYQRHIVRNLTRVSVLVCPILTRFLPVKKLFIIDLLSYSSITNSYSINDILNLNPLINSSKHEFDHFRTELLNWRLRTN